MFKNYNDYKSNRKKVEFLKLNLIDNNIIKCSIAIIIPHRNRIDHLKKFIKHIESMKNIQKDNKLDIFIIDQNNGDKFNRGFLLNIGYLIAKKHFNYDRFIFHDVDSYPDKDLFKLYFEFLNYNIHFASPDLGYKYTFDQFLGGVYGSTKNDFEKVNGFPNDFFGWGGEDDAFLNRCVKENIKIYRPTKGSYILEDHEGPTKSEKNNKKFENILNDLINSPKNGLKQLLDLFINLKKFSIDEFISSYNENNKNKSESIQTFQDYDFENYIAYKVDYLALHSINYDTLLNKDFIKNKIDKKIELFKENKYYQNTNHPEIISYIEPLTSLDEINEKIFKTFTRINSFKINNNLSKRDNKIKNLVFDSFKNSKVNDNDLFSTIKCIFENLNELLYFRIRNNKIECSYHLYNFENKIDFLKNIKMDESLIDIMNAQNKPYYTLRKPHFLPIDNCLVNFESYQEINSLHIDSAKCYKEMFEYTIKKFKNVPDCDILINPKEYSLITKENKYLFNKFYFIGSKLVKNTDIDIPVPSLIDWNIKKSKIKWEDKINKASFRGKLFGCESDSILKLLDLSNENDLIDAKLTGFDKTIKIYNQFIGLENINKYDKYLVDDLDYSNYKYEFNQTKINNSVNLKIESEYYNWFDNLDKYKIVIKSDFSNLNKKVNYLKHNDNNAKEIGIKNYKFKKKYLNKEMIATFWFYYMLNINQQVHFD